MAENSKAKKRKVEESEPCLEGAWPNLPFVQLADVYSYLCPEDLYIMPDAHCNWSKSFSQLHLWRSFVFNLTEEKLTDECWDELIYVKENCHVLEQVFIPYCMDTDDARKIQLWSKQFCRLMNILKNYTQLQFIGFYHFGSLFFNIDKDRYETICEVIAGFLESQKKLKTVSFHQCFFEPANGVDFLQKAIKNNRFIRHIDLSGYVKYSDKKAKHDHLLPAIAGLQKLELIVIDYLLILDRDSDPCGVLKALKNYRRRATLQIILFMNLSAFDLRRFESKQWKELKEANKLLQVEMKVFTDSITRPRNEVFIVEHMPLTYLWFTFSKNCPYENFDHFFNHILSCHVYEHLLEFGLCLEKSVTDLPKAFRQFFNSCRHLKEVKMKMVNPVNDLKDFLQSFAQNRPNSLQIFKLEISNVGNIENKMMLEELTSNFVQTLKLEVKLYL